MPDKKKSRIKERIYFYVTNNGCINSRLYISFEEAVKEGASGIDVFEESGERILHYEKVVSMNGESKYIPHPVI